MLGQLYLSISIRKHCWEFDWVSGCDVAICDPPVAPVVATVWSHVVATPLVPKTTQVGVGGGGSDTDVFDLLWFNNILKQYCVS